MTPPRRRADAGRPPGTPGAGRPAGAAVPRWRSTRRAASTATAALLIAASVFLLWPAPIGAVAWEPSPPPAPAGSFALDGGLAEASVLFEEELLQPEHIAVDERGDVYVGTADGVVHRISDAAGDRPRLERFAEVPGRPLGLRLTPAGELLVAAGDGGLLALAPDGTVRTLSDRRANSVDVASDGTVYFTEAADRPDRDFPLGMLEQRPYGRLFALPPGQARPRVLVDGLVFANGVALTADERSVLVVETFRYRIHRHWIAGPRAGTTEVWADDLPAIPDNLASDRAGTVWVGFPALRSALLDQALHPRPWLKDQVAKATPLIRALGSGADSGIVAAFDERGRALGSLHDPTGQYTGTSAAVPDPDRGVLYVGSLFDEGLARVELPAFGAASP